MERRGGGDKGQRKKEEERVWKVSLIIQAAQLLSRLKQNVSKCHSPSMTFRGRDVFIAVSQKAAVQMYLTSGWG